MRGQLLKDGTIGKRGTFDFVDASVIAQHLNETGSDIMLTVGLSYRNPRTHNKVMSKRDAIDWLMRSNGFYVFDACYTGKDEYLHVQALSGNDLF